MRVQTRKRIEYLCKGQFLGLSVILVFGSTNSRAAVGVVAGTLLILFLGLFVQGWRDRSVRGKLRGRRIAYLALNFLDHPTVVYAAILAGLLLSGLIAGWPVLWVSAALGLGSALGFGLSVVLGFPKRWHRMIAGVVLLAIFGSIVWLPYHFALVAPAGAANARALGLLGSVILFYLLTLGGRTEESEFEIAVLCLGLSLAMAQLKLAPMMRGLVVLFPMALYVVYCERIRKHLILFKHAIRGISYEQQGDLRNALVCYRQALTIHSKSDLAVAGNWRVHQKINLAELADDDEIIAMIDPLVCLSRARLLLDRDAPDPQQLIEAGKLLDIVGFRRKDLPQTIGYERLRCLLAAGNVDEAHSLANALVSLPARQIPALPDHEAEALFKAWTLALKDPQLASTSSAELFADEDRFFCFLAVIGRRLSQWSQDDDALAFRALCYDKLTLAAYDRYVEREPEDAMEWLDHEYCRQLGLHPNDITCDSERQRRERACEFLRIAEQGLPAKRLEIWSAIAQLFKANHDPAAVEWYERVKRFGLGRGKENLSAAERLAFDECVRELGERALEAGDLSAAIENYQLYSESSKAGLTTLKTLKELYERQGDTVLAIRPVEAALTYRLDEAQRKQWKAEKDRLYAALDATQVTPKLKQIEKFFDFGYCLRRAKALFEQEAPHEDVTRFLDLAALGGTDQLLGVNYLLGRAHFRAGKFDDAALCLEAVQDNRPEKFRDSDQEEMYFSACRILGDVYLEHLNEPAKAIKSYSIYKDYFKSGADTLFKLARAYESDSQPAHARKWYDMVLVYPNHPRADAARQALERLKAS